MPVTPERRTRADLVAALLITVVVTVVALVIWLRSDYRHTQLEVASPPVPAVEPATAAPTAVQELWAAPNSAAGQPVVVSGAVVSAEGGAVMGRAAGTGEVEWRYQRNRALCSVTSRDDDIIAVYRTARGCTQVTVLDASTGSRGPQRSSDADQELLIHSYGAHVLAFGSERLEVWRTDMVRTLEFGRVAAPVNPNRQPRGGCAINDALLSRARVATVLHCQDEPGERLVMLNATPERNSEPEELGSALITTHDAALGAVPGANGARIAAASAQSTAIFVPGDMAELVTYDTAATELARWPLIDVPVAEGSARPGGAPTVTVDPAANAAGYVHNPTDTAYWFTGSDVVGLSARDFRPLWRIPDATGIPAVMGGELLVPTADGIGVHDARTGEFQRLIAVDRGGASATALSVTGTYIVEQRTTPEADTSDSVLVVLGPA